MNFGVYVLVAGDCLLHRDYGLPTPTSRSHSRRAARLDSVAGIALIGRGAPDHVCEQRKRSRGAARLMHLRQTSRVPSTNSTQA